MRTNMVWLFWLGLAWVDRGAVEQTSGVVSVSGTMSSGGANTNLSATAQAVGCHAASGGGWVHYVGFLGTFVLRVDLDTDGDGLPDELDCDNDGDEAAAGTNPTEADSRFAFVDIAVEDGMLDLAWLARGNNERLYIVREWTALRDGDSRVVFSNRIAGGEAPWYAVTGAVTEATGAGNRYYTVEAGP